MAALTAGDVAELPAVELEATLRIAEAVPLLLRSAQYVFPVTRDDRVVGVVLREDLMALAVQAGSRLLPVRAVMRAVPEIAAHTNLEQALERLAALDAPVGIVTGPESPLGLLSARHVLTVLAHAPQIDWRAPSREPESRRSGSSSRSPAPGLGE